MDVLVMFNPEDDKLLAGPGWCLAGALLVMFVDLVSHHVDMYNVGPPVINCYINPINYNCKYHKP